MLDNVCVTGIGRIVRRQGKESEVEYYDLWVFFVNK